MAPTDDHVPPMQHPMRFLACSYGTCGSISRALTVLRRRRHLAPTRLHGEGPAARA